jgi:hypothetical protein
VTDIEEMREAARNGPALMPEAAAAARQRPFFLLMKLPPTKPLEMRENYRPSAIAPAHLLLPPSESAVAEEYAAAVGNDAGEHHEGGDATPEWPHSGARNSSAPYALAMEIVDGDELSKLLHCAFAEIWEVFSGNDWSSSGPWLKISSNVSKDLELNRSRIHFTHNTLSRNMKNHKGQVHNNHAFYLRLHYTK